MILLANSTNEKQKLKKVNELTEIYLLSRKNNCIKLLEKIEQNKMQQYTAVSLYDD